MRKRNLAISLFALATTLCADDMVATLDGRKVILHDNLTWEFAASRGAEEPGLVVLGRSPSFDKTIASKKWSYSISYDSSAWDIVPSDNGSVEYTIRNKDNTAFGMCVYDGLSIPLPSLAAIMLDNAKSQDPQARILDERGCRNDDKLGELVTYTATVHGLTFVFYSFITTKDAGTIQFTFYTLDSAFEKLRPEFETAMTGLNF